MILFTKTCWAILTETLLHPNVTSIITIENKTVCVNREGRA